MTHDDFCLTPDQDPCAVCDLIKRVRMDEQDAIAGLYETDVDDVSAAAYQRGYEDGKSSIKPIASPISESSIDLDVIKQYILKRVNGAPLAETNGLYALYTFLGGK